MTCMSALRTTASISWSSASLISVTSCTVPLTRGRSGRARPARSGPARAARPSVPSSRRTRASKVKSVRVRCASRMARTHRAAGRASTSAVPEVARPRCGARSGSSPSSAYICRELASSEVAQVELPAAEAGDGLRLVELARGCARARASASRRWRSSVTRWTQAVGRPRRVSDALADHQRDEGAVLADVGCTRPRCGSGRAPAQLLEVAARNSSRPCSSWASVRDMPWQLGVRVAEEVGHPLVDVDGAAGAVEDPDAVAGGLDELPEEGIRAVHGGLLGGRSGGEGWTSGGGFSVGASRRPGGRDRSRRSPDGDRASDRDPAQPRPDRLAAVDALAEDGMASTIVAAG